MCPWDASSEMLSKHILENTLNSKNAVLQFRRVAHKQGLGQNRLNFALWGKKPPRQGWALPSLQPWVPKSLETGANLFITHGPCTSDISFISSDSIEQD